MTQSSNEVLEMILRECGEANGEPWYPTEYANATGMDRAVIDASVDDLRIGGLISITEWVKDKGQGYILTPAGADVLQNPRWLSRLRTQGITTEAELQPRLNVTPGAEPLPTWDRSKAIHDAMTSPARPIVTMTLLFVNVVNFIFGLMLVMQMNVPMNQYLGQQANAKIRHVRHVTGGMFLKSDVSAGHWWKLLTSCFVHQGLLHLALNMFALYMLGPFAEQMWGRLRYLIMYLFAGVAGSVAAVLFDDLPAGADPLLGGASGAICGILGSILPWVLLNWRYLPKQMASGLLRNCLVNGVLIAFISLIPGISWQAHLGGGVAGAAIGVPLVFSRFGAGVQRFLGWAGVILVPLLFFGYAAQRLEPTEEATARALLNQVDKYCDTADEAFLKLVNKNIKGKKITEAEHEDVSSKLQKAQLEIKETNDWLDSRKSTELRTAIGHAKEFTNSWRRYLDEMQKSVNGNQFTGKAWQNLETSFAPAIHRSEEALNDSRLYLKKRK